MPVEIIGKEIDGKQDADNQYHHADQNIDDLVHQESLDGFLHGNPLVFCHHGAPPEIARTRQQEVDGIIAERGIHDAGTHGAISQ